MGANPANQLRILIIAEHASARFGGEAILPLHYFRVLRARGIETWLIVHSRTRDELAGRFPHELGRMFFIPDTRLHRLLNRLEQFLPRRVGYFTLGWMSRLLSQWMARRVARRLVREKQIDVIHQPIPVSPKETSLLYNMGAPVIIGPMNGGMSFPPGFGRQHARGEKSFVRFGRWASQLLNRMMPGKLRADVLLVANERTRRALPKGVRGRVIELVENGVDLSLWAADEQHQQFNPAPRFVFLGRLEDWKAVNLLLDAFKDVVAQQPATLEIIGDGPMRASLEDQTRRLGVEQHVQFGGWLTQSDAALRLRAADALMLPSLYECGGAVVLEAMALGLPVIATAWGGPADYLDESCGILVPPTTPGQFVKDLAGAMLRLAKSPELRRQLGSAGRRKIAETFDWERKVDRILEVYAEVAQKRMQGAKCKMRNAK
ncbi:MAG TPA: glycosyltransferase family 4 protein [Tepidisphaeraceae bacterium]|nr:glycosyltransferase family 4 protein [Tepidisphaeraceae bacterium]